MCAYKVLFVFALLISCNFAGAQVVNGYAKVTAISTATLTLSNVNEAADTFEDDEWVVLMQMQGDVIGTTTDVVGFGNLSSINSTGLYEIRQIDSHTETGGVPNTITLKNTPNFTYNICTNCSVQIITFRQYGSPDYTTTANMSALPWDGNIGGVLAFYVAGKLTLAHNLSADEDGFRGAATNAGGSLSCTGSSAYRLATNVNHADKGEGIYKRTNATYAAGRAKILNAGGGGNSHNAGGGGGGNYTAGGDGGPGWNNCSPSAGGIGGISLSSEITVGRIFMGGAGGAGEGNNGFSTQGKNGGGIILVKAEEIETVTCAGITISADGGSVPGTGGNDGGGGGGAGGTLVFEVDTWTIAGGCPLTISANGGNGGNVNTAATHGGGGGQGALFFSTTAPTVNVTLETNSGDGGCNNSSVPCNSQASGGGGIDGSGILDILTGPLPIELVEFNATKADQTVHLTWITKSERNNSHFVIEKSLSGNEWMPISTLAGAGNSSELLFYQIWDFNPSIGFNYYRLKQVDFDGSFSYSDMRTVNFQSEAGLIFPNPTTGIVQVSGMPQGLETIYIYDTLGRIVFYKDTFEAQQDFELDLSFLPNGSYSILFKSKTGIETTRLIISH